MKLWSNSCSHVKQSTRLQSVYNELINEPIVSLASKFITNKTSSRTIRSAVIKSILGDVIFLRLIYKEGCPRVSTMSESKDKSNTVADSLYGT